MRLHFEHEKNLISTSFDKITTTNYFRNTINNGPVEELSFDYGDGTLFSDYYSSKAIVETTTTSEILNLFPPHKGLTVTTGLPTFLHAL